MRRAALVMAALLGAAVSVAGCGEAEKSAPGGETSTPAATTPTTAALTPAATVQAYLDAIEGSDYGRICDLVGGQIEAELAAPTKGKCEVGVEQWLTSEAHERDTAARTTVDGETISGDTATVTLLFDRDRSELVLERDDSQWLIVDVVDAEQDASRPPGATAPEAPLTPPPGITSQE